MWVSVLIAAQLTGWLPSPPPRNPIIDPVFAASPIREFRRAWDDCIGEVKQLVLINGLTDEKAALNLMTTACADYDDRLTGALVNKFGYGKATRSMAKARQQATSSMREYLKQVGALSAQTPSPTPRAVAKPLWTTTKLPNGACESTYVTGSGGYRRKILFQSRGSGLSSSGTIGFVFPSSAVPDVPVSKSRAISFNMIIRSTSGADTDLRAIRGGLGQDAGEAYVVTKYGEKVRSSIETAPSITTITIFGDWWPDPVEFPAKGLSAMVGDTLSCVDQARQ
jgi:hypothetical protein